MGSDPSSEIDSLHSSDIDFIDDRVYEISSDENAKIRPKRCFLFIFIQFLAKTHIEGQQKRLRRKEKRREMQRKQENYASNV